MPFLKKSLFLLLIAFGIGYYYRADLRAYWNRFLPCSYPITYSIGVFDERFDIVKQSFLRDVQQAEEVWESQAGKELFQHVENGGELTLNLIYDERQATTDELKEIGSIISTNKEAYNSLKERYDALSLSYESRKNRLESGIRNLESMRKTYEEEVRYWDERWGAPRKEYRELEEKRLAINRLVASLNALQAEINATGETLNGLASAINQLIESHNLNVEKYNTSRTANGEEFDEGEFIRDTTGQRINIYQFENETKLFRVLTHELGHALGLQHVSDSEAIMYKLNQGSNEKLSNADIQELAKVCRLQERGTERE